MQFYFKYFPSFPILIIKNTVTFFFFFYTHWKFGSKGDVTIKDYSDSSTKWQIPEIGGQNTGRNTKHIHHKRVAAVFETTRFFFCLDRNIVCTRNTYICADGLVVGLCRETFGVIYELFGHVIAAKLM